MCLVVVSCGVISLRIVFLVNVVNIIGSVYKVTLLSFVISLFMSKKRTPCNQDNLIKLGLMVFR